MKAIFAGLGALLLLILVSLLLIKIHNPVREVTPAPEIPVSEYRLEVPADSNDK